MNAQIISSETRAAVTRRGRNLEYLTIGWNSLEAIAAIGAGLLAGSIALVGFGFDSVIESLSGAVVLWRLFAGEVREKLALRLVGGSFLILALYVGYDAVKSLILRQPPEASYLGIAIAALSLVVMPMLAKAKRGVAVSLNSRAMLADSRQTDICAYLSAILLGTVIAVEANPASDLLVLDGDRLIPLVFVVSHAPGLVVVDPPDGLWG